MSAGEVIWRIRQKVEQKLENHRFRRHQPVDRPLYPGVAATVAALTPTPLGSQALSLLPLSPSPLLSTPIAHSHEAVRLYGYRYEDYATDWHAGFNTPARWPLLPSSTLSYRQRDDIGDARINWELNRLRQFARLAAASLAAPATPVGPDASPAQASPAELLARLNFLFDDWVAHNPFLYGISWTSPMEVAIRMMQWIYAARFLALAITSAEAPAWQTATRLLTGAANMAEYVSRHLSGYSSANNHLVVEAAALVTAGAALNRPELITRATAILDRELAVQVTADGVDRESSLHYHTFVLEAYLLAVNELRNAGQPVPAHWQQRLGAMASFIEASRVPAPASPAKDSPTQEASAAESPASSQDSSTQPASTKDSPASAEGAAPLYAIFGDDDGARILDLNFGDDDYYALQVRRYHTLFTAPKAQQASSCYRPCTADPEAPSPDAAAIYRAPTADATLAPANFIEGGYSFLREGRMFAAIDHAPLGFGTIAAHAHADALSFQLFVDGRPVFIDPGTYLYHADLPRRNRLRSSLMHNTVTINGCEQSQMLGPFLWGKKATTRLLHASPHSCQAEVHTLSGITHRRTITLTPAPTPAPTPDAAAIYRAPTAEAPTAAEAHAADSPAGQLIIEDSFSAPCHWEATLLLAPGLTPEITGNTALVRLPSGATLVIAATSFSPEAAEADSQVAITATTEEVAAGYGSLTTAIALRISGTAPVLTTTITLR